MNGLEDRENKIGFIINRYKDSDGSYIAEVNVDFIKSQAKNYEQNLNETIKIYHEVVNNGIENISILSSEE